MRENRNGAYPDAAKLSVQRAICGHTDDLALSVNCSGSDCTGDDDVRNLARPSGFARNDGADGGESASDPRFLMRHPTTTYKTKTRKKRERTHGV